MRVAAGRPIYCVDGPLIAEEVHRLHSCAICCGGPKDGFVIREGGRNVVTHMCGHSFCGVCLDRYQDSIPGDQKLLCPTCRRVAQQPLKPKSLPDGLDMATNVAWLSEMLSEDSIWSRFYRAVGAALKRSPFQVSDEGTVCSTLESYVSCVAQDGGGEERSAAEEREKVRAAYTKLLEEHLPWVDYLVRAIVGHMTTSSCVADVQLFGGYYGHTFITAPIFDDVYAARAARKWYHSWRTSEVVEKIHAGDHVVIARLVNSAHLNGLEGVAVSYNGERWVVEVARRETTISYKVKPANLVVKPPNS